MIGSEQESIKTLFNEFGFLLVQDVMISRTSKDKMTCETIMNMDADNLAGYLLLQMSGEEIADLSMSCARIQAFRKNKK